MIDYFVDKSGQARATGFDRESTALAHYLEEEIENSMLGVASIEEVISEIESGVLKFWEMTGNASHIEIKSGWVSIENQFADLSCKLSLAEFSTAVKSWKKVLQEAGCGD